MTRAGEGRIAGYRIEGGQSAGIVMNLQPVTHRRGQPMSQLGQNEKVSQRPLLDRCTSESRPSFAPRALVGLLSMPAIVARTFAEVADLVPPPLRPGETLPNPDFSLLRPINPYVVGIRPHREGGVCLKLEDEPIPSRYGPKFLIHNYGHGGAGISLSFGCASVDVDYIETLT
jgi:hypothetical protein